MRLTILLTAGAALALSYPAFAQDTAPAADYVPSTKGLLPEVPADGCELHIWPAERMKS